MPNAQAVGVKLRYAIIAFEIDLTANFAAAAELFRLNVLSDQNVCAAVYDAGLSVTDSYSSVRAHGGEGDGVS